MNYKIFCFTVLLAAALVSEVEPLSLVKDDDKSGLGLTGNNNAFGLTDGNKNLGNNKDLGFFYLVQNDDINPSNRVINGNSPINGVINGNSPINGVNNGNSPINGVINGNSPINGIINGNSPINGVINGNSPINGLNNGNSPINGLNDSTNPFNGLNDFINSLTGKLSMSDLVDAIERDPMMEMLFNGQLEKKAKGVVSDMQWGMKMGTEMVKEKMFQNFPILSSFGISLDG